MELISLLLIGVGLSMDAFSLSLCYGVLEISEMKRRLLSLIVGCFHFFMPLFGIAVGNIVERSIIMDIRYIVFIVFMLLGVEMIMSAFKKDATVILLNIVGLFLFAFAVSMDSFFAGIGIHFLSSNYLLGSIIFSIMSSVFTYTGLKLGRLIGIKYEGISKFIGGIILIAFALIYLFR